MPANPHNPPEQQGNNRGGNPPEEYRFKPGQSGNPGGRPKGKTLLRTVREALEEHPELLGEIAQGFIDSMKRGSFQHLKEFIDREEGKVPDRVANADGSNIDGYDLARLSLDELIVLRNLQRKAAVQSSGAGSGDLPPQPE